MSLEITELRINSFDVVNEYGVYNNFLLQVFGIVLILLSVVFPLVASQGMMIAILLYNNMCIVGRFCGIILP